MRIDDERESDNVEDQRGSGGGGGFGFPGLGGGGGLGLPLGGRGLGCGGILLIGVVALVMGINPLQLLGLAGGAGGPGQQIGQPQAPRAAGPGAAGESNTDRFVRRVLASTEDVWAKVLPDQANTRYTDPTLVLYDGTGASACGTAQSAMGPFYCPNDRKLYLDESFFDELSTKFGAPGQAASAYVIAHEVGHHIQNLLGLLDQANQRQSGASKREGNAIQVRVELQADCFAGVWAKQSGRFDASDAEGALKAAASVGDDRLQQQSQGVVIPESFTHGSSAQRMRWFSRGFDSGEIGQCDTMKASSL